MSRIYFHSEHGDAEIRGSERAFMGCVIGDIFQGLFPRNSFGRSDEWLKNIVPQDVWSAEKAFGNSLGFYLRSVGGDRPFNVNGKDVSVWETSLNTAIVLGDAPLKLFARLHGQCEIHCFVEGRNRKWLAGIIRQGRASGLYREDQGWEATASFLEARDDCPVVCSSSVCEQFPNYGVIPHDHPLSPLADDDEDKQCEKQDAFNELSDAEQWSICIQRLRESRPFAELKPETFCGLLSEDGYTYFTLPKS